MSDQQAQMNSSLQKLNDERLMAQISHKKLKAQEREYLHTLREL